VKVLEKYCPEKLTYRDGKTVFLRDFAQVAREIKKENPQSGNEPN